MASANVEIRLRPNTVDENLGIIRGIHSKSKVDDRSRDELHKLFVSINARCSKQSFKSKGNSFFPEKHEKTIAQYGPVPSSPSGSWWGIRMDCARDGVHGPFNESIQDGPFGAFSICTSHLNTDDVDLGETLSFTGHEYISKTDVTNDSLVLSYKNQIPLRLVRSYNLSNDYSPKTGYRYDGLYIVVAYWIGVSRNSKKYLKFALSRVINQDKPPWTKSISISIKQHIEEPTIIARTRSHNLATKPKETQKFVYEKSPEKQSAIVTRQVFNKFSSPESTATTGKSIRQINASPSKLCNTNIAIRTDLYDSSHNLQPESKKTPMTFCRIFKPSRLKPTQVQLNDTETTLGKVDETRKPTEQPNLTLQNSFSTMCDPFLKPSSSIDSLTPDILVSLLVKEKYHPMAKLLIGNMIGLENEESAMLNAYNALTSKADSEEESAKQEKVQQKRKFFQPRRVTRKLRNGIRKPGITNLIIEKPGLTELKKRNGISKTRRIQFQAIKLIKKRNRERISKKIDRSKDFAKVDQSIQCTLLQELFVDKSSQTVDENREDVKLEVIDLEEVKSEPDTSDCSSPEPESIENVNPTSSAFVPVSVDSSIRIARLRSIGFRPIGFSPPLEIGQREVDEEYKKYTNEETTVVGYMDEPLHFENIESEDSRLRKKPRKKKNSVDEDFERPWHGWKKVTKNGRVFWTGY